MPVLTQALKTALKGLVPPSYLLNLRMNRLVHRALRDGEPELRLLPRLLADGGAFVDVGANFGVYAAYAIRHASDVYIFEPHPDLSRELAQIFAGRAHVNPIALSDRSGTVEFLIPRLHHRDIHSRGSIETVHSADFTEMRSVKVERRRLDDLAIPDVAVIKIDVEGHELAVLKGSHETLAKHRPSVIVEVEEFRSAGAFDNITSLLGDLGYLGFFIYRGEVRSLNDFDVDHYQDPGRRAKFGDSQRDPEFINNFLFVHEGKPSLIWPGMRL